VGLRAATRRRDDQGGEGPGRAGGGHGWNSSLVSGLAGLVLLPAFGVAVGLPGLRAGRILLWLVVPLALLADTQLTWLTWGERYYFDKVWQRGAEAIVFWAILQQADAHAVLGQKPWICDHPVPKRGEESAPRCALRKPG
jgi:hypothetical protein